MGSVKYGISTAYRSFNILIDVIYRIELQLPPNPSIALDRVIFDSLFDRQALPVLACRLIEFVKMPALIAKPKPSLFATDRENCRRSS